MSAGVRAETRRVATGLVMSWCACVLATRVMAARPVASAAAVTPREIFCQRFMTQGRGDYPAERPEWRGRRAAGGDRRGTVRSQGASRPEKHVTDVPGLICYRSCRLPVPPWNPLGEFDRRYFDNRAP